MTPFAEAVDSILSKLVLDVRKQLEGIPEDDLNNWRPALGLEDVNTFYALTTHLIGAGEYWILHAAGGRPTNRNRPAEFHASGTLADLEARLDRWMTDVRGYLQTLSYDDLGRIFERGGDDPDHRAFANAILHGVEHTGVHLGHLQLQRQIWNAERGFSAPS